MGGPRKTTVAMRSIRSALVTVALSATAVTGALLAAPLTASAAPAAVAGMVGPVDSKAIAADARRVLDDLHVAVSTGDPVIRSWFEAERDLLAAAVAGPLRIEPARMQAAWASADTAHQIAVLAALTQLGVPYRHNTSVANSGFDCSGLTTYAWGVAGVRLTRQSRSQIQEATAVASASAQAGDLVYYPGHVSMYLGVDRAIVHAVGTGRFVEIGFTRTGKSVKFANPEG